MSYQAIRDLEETSIHIVNERSKSERLPTTYPQHSKKMEKGKEKKRKEGY